MSGNVGFGGPSSGGSWSAGTLYSDGIPLPQGRAMANGSTNAAITALFGYVGGHYNARTISLQLGPALTGLFTVPAQSSNVGTGYHAVGPWLVNGGTTRFSANGPQPGGLYFGHGGGGQTVGPGGYVRPGTLGGAYSWIEAPAAPTMLTAVPGENGTVQVRFTSSPDTGGAAITGWVLQYATNPSFTNASDVNGLSGVVDLTLTPGTQYWFRAAGRNWVTDASGTYGPWASPIAATTQGLPSAPKSLTAVNSTTVFNQVKLSWQAPDSPNGTITGYDIYDGSIKTGSTSGTGTTYNTVGFSNFSTHTLSVRARNGYADSIGTAGPASNTVTITTSSAPTAPRNLTAVASGSTPGKISLAWSPPINTGVGGVTRYDIYQTTGALLAGNVPAGTTTYDLFNLRASTSYGFFVVAWNAIATAVGTHGANSNIAFASTLGAPDPVTSLSLTPSTKVAGRLTLSWAPVGTATGYNIYELYLSSTATYVGSTKSLTTYVLDNLSSGPHTYIIRTRNVYTDLTETEGPDSTHAVTATPGTSSNQALVSGAILNEDNALFTGTQVLTAVTNTSISYTKTAANRLLSDASSGTLTDTSNQALSGTFTIVATPATNSLTYAATLGNIATTAAGGSLVDNTNVTLSGTHTVSVSDENNKKVSYAATLPNHALVASTGTIENQSNIVYNTASAVLADVTSNTLVYGKTHADLAETLATGTATDITNRDIYNGDYSIETVPTFDSLTVARTAADQDDAEVLDPGGDMFRTVSAGELEVRYRSGWLG